MQNSCRSFSTPSRSRRRERSIGAGLADGTARRAGYRLCPPAVQDLKGHDTVLQLHVVPPWPTLRGCSFDRRFEPLTRSECCRVWVLWTRVPRMPSRPPAQPDRSVPRKIGGSLRVRAVTRCSGCGQTTASRECSRPNATLSTLWRRMAIMHNRVLGYAWKRLWWTGDRPPAYARIWERNSLVLSSCGLSKNPSVVFSSMICP